jgi:hypothetical protein
MQNLRRLLDHLRQYFPASSSSSSSPSVGVPNALHGNTSSSNVSNALNAIQGSGGLDYGPPSFPSHSNEPSAEIPQFNQPPPGSAPQRTLPGQPTNAVWTANYNRVRPLDFRSVHPNAGQPGPTPPTVNDAQAQSLAASEQAGNPSFGEHVLSDGSDDQDELINFGDIFGRASNE